MSNNLGSLSLLVENYFTLQRKILLITDFSTSPSEHLKNGDGFSVLVKVSNDTTEKKTVDVSAVLHSTKHTGEKKFFIKRQRFSAISLEANQSNFVGTV